MGKEIPGGFAGDLGGSPSGEDDPARRARRVSETGRESRQRALTGGVGVSGRGARDERRRWRVGLRFGALTRLGAAWARGAGWAAEVECKRRGGERAGAAVGRAGQAARGGKTGRRCGLAEALAWVGPSGRRRGVGRGLGFVWVRFWLGFGLSGFWVFFFLLFSFLNLIQSKFEFKFEFEFKPHSNKIMHQHECNKNLNLWQNFNYLRNKN